MHPAYSVILFTTASGAGYGLLAWLGLSQVLSAPAESMRWANFIALFLGGLLVTIGLLSSTFHLGHPERAWRAFSQWRSSWLSREGVVSVLTYIPMAVLGIIWLFGIDAPRGLMFVLGLLLLIGAMVTVYCTGMIYASLRTIRQWNHWSVPVLYILLSLGTGAMLLAFLHVLTGAPTGFMAWFAVVWLAAALLAKVAYWVFIDQRKPLYTTEMAIGIKGAKSITPLDPPHTRPNFVMREMGFEVARKHALNLRLVSALCFGLAIFALVVAAVAGWASFWIILATILVGVGVVVERWLFFGEAEHVSMLYYGKAAA